MHSLHVVSRLLDRVYLPTCAACDRPLGPLPGLCEPCALSLEVPAAACPRCALPADDGSDAPCDRCRRLPPPFGSIAAPFLYRGELAAALRRLKFGGRRDVARTLAPLLAGPMARASAACDLVVPVPLHRARLARRGFNQAALLAHHARRGEGPPIDVLSLKRVRPTAPQTGLDAPGRRENIDGAFAVVPGRRRRLVGRRVLLVDDVVTTGATMAAAAAALLAGGARSVDGFCAARAPS